MTIAPATYDAVVCGAGIAGIARRDSILYMIYLYYI